MFKRFRAWRAHRRGLWWAERARNVAAVTQEQRDRQIRLLMLRKAQENPEPEPLDRWGYPTLASAPTIKEWWERWERIKRREHIADLEKEAGIETVYDQDPRVTSEDLGTT